MACLFLFQLFQSEPLVCSRHTRAVSQVRWLAEPFVNEEQAHEALQTIAVTLAHVESAMETVEVRRREREQEQQVHLWHIRTRGNSAVSHLKPHLHELTLLLHSLSAEIQYLSYLPFFRAAREPANGQGFQPSFASCVRRFECGRE